MPELPEVESLRRMLARRVVGRKILRTRTLLPRIVRQGRLGNLVGRTFTSVARYGKFLCFDTDDRLKLFVHLRMTGGLLWEGDLDGIPSHIRAVICFDDDRLLYRDVRTLGGLWVSRNGAAPWKRLGIDPFDPAFTPEELKQLFSVRRLPVKLALLDQTLIAGIGNIYASEILFAAGIDPRRPVSSLSGDELVGLHDAVGRILNAAIEFQGTTFRDFRLSDGRQGRFRNLLNVYGRGGEHCRRCDGIIERITQAQRSTCFCPSCQH